MIKKVAVVLCGSGYKDGSEIRESVGVLWALSVEKAQVSIFAPDEPQFDVVNCLTGEPAQEKRNQLVESARIARGDVKPIAKLDPAQFDAIVLPGGFGAAKNLCSFAREGSAGKVHPELQRALHGFHKAGKPMGAVCIAPAILALAFPKAGFELTLGEESEAAQEIEKLGHKHMPRPSSIWHTDPKHKVSTTPAYMNDDASLRDVFAGIQGMVRDVLAMAD